MASIPAHSFPQKLCPHLCMFSFFRSPSFIAPTWSLSPGDLVTLSLRNPSLAPVKLGAKGAIHLYFFLFSLNSSWKEVVAVESTFYIHSV